MLTDDEKRELIAEAREWAKYDATGASRIVLALCEAADAPDSDWEYGLVNPDALPGEYGRDDRAHLVSSSREHIERQQSRGHPAIKAMRRRKAGPWLPVEGESKP